MTSQDQNEAIAKQKMTTRKANMLTIREKNEKRKSRQFWAVNEGRVQRVTCYECQPNDDIWWCPELGYSASTKHEFFETEREAVRKAIADLETAETGIINLLTNLRARLH